MVGQLSAGASFDEAFQAGMKAGVVSAVAAGAAYGVNDYLGLNPTGVDATGKLTYSEAAMRYHRLSAVEKLGTGTFWAQASSNAVTRGVLAQAQGGKFATGMVGGFTGTMLSSTAQIIGDVTGEGFSLENVLLHTGLGCVGALAAGDKCAAGAIGGGVSAVVSPWVGKAFSESGPRTPVEKMITAVTSVTAGMGVAAALGYDHLPAGQAAQNEVMNNFLNHIEAEERAAAQRRLNACGEDAVCKAQASAEIARLNELDEQRDRDMEHACRLPTSAACQGWRAQLLDAQNSYKEMSNQADLSVLKEKSEIEQLVGTFDARVKHSTTFNAVTGATQSVGEGITGTAQLLELSRRALAGDAQAQAQLRQIGATLRKALANPVDTVSQSIKDELALADWLDNQGRPDEATQVRSKLVTSGVLSVTGAGAVAVNGIRTAVRLTSHQLDDLAVETLLRSGGAFDKSGNPLLDLKQLTNEQKAVMGDLFGSNTVNKIIPNGEKLARIPGIGETGIDDLYKVSSPGVDYVIIEYKFLGAKNKTGASALGKTRDGLQGSEAWVLGSGRLEKAVGRQKALDIYKAIDKGRTETWVVTTRPDGATQVQVLDRLGKPRPIDSSKIINPTFNLSGAQP